MSTDPGFEYVLGSDETERTRLASQQSVWAEETDAWLDLLRVGPGATVLDAGCGPGEALALLARRVGPSGRLVGIDDSPRWITHVEARAREEGWPTLDLHRGRLESVAADGSLDTTFDGIFCRWVLSFPPDPGALVARFARWLKPGGHLVVVDYNHEGVSLYPESEPFRAMIRAVRAWYASQGGSAFVAGAVPRMLREAGLELVDQRPFVKCGRPGSPVWSWVEDFLLGHSHAMERSGHLTAQEAAAFRADWGARSEDPDACFYSPIVVGFGARKP
jgi:ubiquinone/menaquinone biosynthesis C-methylase UbiE